MSCKLSIITVCYNSEKTIERTIKSVITQDYTDYEYIIVDGGSTDGTIDIIRKYSPYITRWISEPDEGIYDAMNKGIQLSSGELIAFINSDDWYVEGAFKAVANCYSDNGEYDLIYGDVFQIENGEKQEVSYKKSDLKQLYVRFFIIHQAIFVKNSLMKAYLFDTEYDVAADYDFVLKLYKSGRVFYHLDRPIVYFSPGGYSNANSAKLASEYKKISLAAIADDQEMKSKYEKAIEDHYYSTMYLVYKDQNDFSTYASKWIENKFDKNCFYFIFGAGVTGRRCLKILRNGGVRHVFFVDNDKEKQGESIDGACIIPPDRLRRKRNVKIVISSLANETGIRKQLNSIVSNRGIIRTYSEIVGSMIKDYEESTGSSLIQNDGEKLRSFW